VTALAVTSQNQEPDALRQRPRVHGRQQPRRRHRAPLLQHLPPTDDRRPVNAATPSTTANTLVTKKGRRECRTCKNEKARDWYRRKAKPKRSASAPPGNGPSHTNHARDSSSLRPAVTMPDTSQCQRCGDPADHNAGTADAICDPCQTRQQRRAARQRYALAIGTRP
jgi:hypothetical protein